MNIFKKTAITFLSSMFLVGVFFTANAMEKKPTAMKSNEFLKKGEDSKKFYTIVLDYFFNKTMMVRSDYEEGRQGNLKNMVFVPVCNGTDENHVIALYILMDELLKGLSCHDKVMKKFENTVICEKSNIYVWGCEWVEDFLESEVKDLKERVENFNAGNVKITEEAVSLAKGKIVEILQGILVNIEMNNKRLSETGPYGFDPLGVPASFAKQQFAYYYNNLLDCQEKIEKASYENIEKVAKDLEFNKNLRKYSQSSNIFDAMV